MNAKIVVLASVALMLFGAVYRILLMPFNGQPGNKKRKERKMRSAEKGLSQSVLPGRPKMGADEIRRLAADATFKAFVSGGPACIAVTSKVKSALLAYAEMVERCERMAGEIEKRQTECHDCKLNLIFKRGFTNLNSRTSTTSFAATREGKERNDEVRNQRRRAKCV